MIHAENSDCIAWLTERLERAGQTEPRFHSASRPPIVEREAAHRAISLAELIDVPILIVHVSSSDAIEQIREAQARSLRIYAETCPQYLFLTAADLDRPGFEGAKSICSPPPRDKATQQLVWNALCDGALQILSSDHAPYRYEDPRGKMLHGAKASFQYVPNGIPGIETRLPLLFSEGVMKGRLQITRFVAVTATNPARMYGLYPRKGTIAVGSDADLVIWDPERRWRIQNENLHHAVDYTPYEGMEMLGFPNTVISRGEIVVKDGEPIALAGRGKFLQCAKPGFALI